MTREDKDDEDTGEPTDQMIAEDQASLLTMEDRFYMTYILFYSLGTAMLVPANFYTTATDYWMYKFRNTSTDLTNGSFNTENRTGMQAEFTSDYSIVSNVSNLAFLVLTILIVRKVTIVKRTIGGLCGTVVMFAITCVFVQINTDTWQRGFFVTTLAIGFFLTAFCSVFMVTLFQMVSKFPPGYLAAILNGQSICGILAALLQIFSLSIGASSKTNGLVYFALGMFFIFMTLVGFLMTLARSEYFQHYLNKEVQIERPKVTKKMVFSIFNKIKYYIISMVIVLGCSIMIHPGVTSLVISTHKGNGNKWNDVFFVPVVTFLFYHVSDYFGRELARIIKKPGNGLVIFILSVIRIAFVPMLMLCNAQPRSHLPVAFDEDYVYIIFIIVFAFTNGYLMNLCVIYVPVVTTEEEKMIATVCILVFMVVSLGACSFISAALVKAL